MVTFTKFAKVSSLVLIASTYAGISNAGVITPCPTEGCGFTVSVSNGSETVNGFGQFSVDGETGDLSLLTDSGTTNGSLTQTGGLHWSLGDGSSVTVSSITGNSDPILTFGIGGTAGASGSTFSFNFDLPITIDGLIDTASSLGGSLTDSNGDGAGIFTTAGNATILSAFEIDTDPVDRLPGLNKGVDIGDSFSFVGNGGLQTQNYGVFSDTDQIIGDLDYELQSIFLDFSLSPNDSYSLSGGVSQFEATVVPVPAAVWLMGGALASMVGFSRRKVSK